MTSQNLAPAMLLGEKERTAIESAMDDAELLALKHAEISGWSRPKRVLNAAACCTIQIYTVCENRISIEYLYRIYSIYICIEYILD